MSVALNDMAALRQRVLASLTKRNSVTSMSVSIDEGLEEGEVEEVDEHVTKVHPKLVESASTTSSTKIVQSLGTVGLFPNGIPGKARIKKMSSSSHLTSARAQRYTPGGSASDSTKADYGGDADAK